jgi:hypothetical protein
MRSYQIRRYVRYRSPRDPAGAVCDWFSSTFVLMDVASISFERETASSATSCNWLENSGQITNLKPWMLSYCLKEVKHFHALIISSLCMHDRSPNLKGLLWYDSYSTYGSVVVLSIPVACGSFWLGSPAGKQPHPGSLAPRSLALAKVQLRLPKKKLALSFALIGELIWDSLPTFLYGTVCLHSALPFQS